MAIFGAGVSAGGGNGPASVPHIPEKYSRFRSFAERYVIERARTFKEGHEVEDGWQATLQAKTIYNSIAGVANSVDKNE